MGEEAVTMKRVYIAGPYTKGDVAENVNRAIRAANLLMDAGAYPYVPHLSHFWHLVYQRPYEDWLALDMAYLECAAAVFRIAGESHGADKEVEWAEAHGVPVFTEMWRVDEWLKIGD